MDLREDASGSGQLLHVSFQGRRDLAGQIYRQIRAAVLDGRLRAGEALPPTRELAARLAVSRNTVGVAYDRLVAEGFATGRVGAGTFISTGILPRATARRGSVAGPLQPRPVWSEISPPSAVMPTPELDFRTGVPDARLFPYETWRRLVARELRPAAVGKGMYADPAGHPGLRAAIARHVAVARAVRADADDVVVTNGIQQALDLVARVVLEPGARVAVEEPGYPPPRQLFLSLGARVAGVPVDAEGLVVDALPRDARLVYVTPAHQFPLGMSMSLRRRMALLAWADRYGAVIVEDDYDSEFRFAGRAIEPLQSLDRSGRVVFVGSFSKVMLPTLRLGFLVAPPSLHAALRAAKWVSDWHAPLPLQAALARFIEEGRLARHIRAMRHEYEARHELIAQTMVRDMAPWLELIPSAAGLHLSAYLRGRTAREARDVARRARTAGVMLHHLGAFGAAGRPGLCLGYGAISTVDIEEGLRRLREVLAG